MPWGKGPRCSGACLVVLLVTGGLVEDPVGAWLWDQGRCCGHSRAPAGPGEHWEALTSLLRLLLGLVLILPGKENHSSDKKTPLHIFSAQRNWPLPG